MVEKAIQDHQKQQAVATQSITKPAANPFAAPTPAANPFAAPAPKPTANPFAA